MVQFWFIMAELECVFQSFSGAGSIFIANNHHGIAYNNLVRHEIGAIVFLGEAKLVRLEGITYFQCSVDEGRLGDQFKKVAGFIYEMRVTTNVIIYTPKRPHISLLFLLAALILRHHHSYKTVTRVFAAPIRKAELTKNHLALLKNLTEPEPQPSKKKNEEKQAYESPISKRIRNINEQYSKFSVKSQEVKEERKKELGINPEYSRQKMQLKPPGFIHSISELEEAMRRDEQQ